LAGGVDWLAAPISGADHSNAFTRRSAGWRLPWRWSRTIERMPRRLSSLAGANRIAHAVRPLFPVGRQ
jgi:hypothetical protein